LIWVYRDWATNFKPFYIKQKGGAKMVINKPRIRMVGFGVFIFLLLFPIQSFAKTYKTDHFNFSVGWLSQYKEEEKKTIAELVDRLDEIWIKINELCDNELNTLGFLR
jgi:hypothetical protein